MTNAPRPRRRSLWPKEHGAYAQLLVPLLAGVMVSWPPSPSALAWGAAAIFAFLAHEPALVWLGQRGPRARAQAGRRALRALVVLAALSLSMVVLAIWFATPDLRVLSVVAFAGLIAVLLVGLGRGRTTLGEWSASIALSGAGSLLASAGGEDSELAFLRWAAWILGFGAATGGVRGVIAAHRKRTEPLAAPLAALCSLACGLGGFVEPELWSAAPLCAASVALLALRPSARHLKKIGVGLVGVALVVAGLQLA